MREIEFLPEGIASAKVLRHTEEASVARAH